LNGEYGLRKTRLEERLSARTKRIAKNVFFSAALMAACSTEPLCGCGTAASNASVMRRDVISGMINGRDRDKDAVAALDAMQRYGSRESAQIVGRVPEYDERARALLSALGMHDDASTRLNFAYAIAAIGEQRTAELHNRLGIDYFMRYSQRMLNEVYDTLQSDYTAGRPLIVIAFNKNDWNGAFYREGQLLDPLLRGYRPILFETDSEGGYYTRIKEIAGRYGLIGTMVVGGHGEAGAIQLGDVSEQGRIDLSDHDELVALRGFFAPRPLIVLISCSTGESEKAIGGEISRDLGARVFAPVIPSSGTTYNLDRNGYISGVTYNVETRSFVDGVAR
jgi:hypothetical protein